MKNVFMLIAMAASLFAGVSVGAPFPDIVLDDQFGKEQRITDDEALVLVSFEKRVSTGVNDFMKLQPKGFLDTHHAKFISDISAMPSLIAKLFALPKMKNYRYSVMLNRDEAFEKQFDRQEGKLTLYRLKEGTVESVAFIAPERIAELFPGDPATSER